MPKMLAAIFSRVRAHTTRSNTELRAPFPSLPAQNSDWLEGCSLLAVYGSEQVPDSLSFSFSLARFLCRLSASTHHRHTHHSDRLPSVVYQSCVLGGTAGTADRCRTCMPTAATSWHEDHRQPNASATGPTAGGRVLGKKQSHRGPVPFM